MPPHYMLPSLFVNISDEAVKYLVTIIRLSGFISPM